jgi:hypothetical protein
LTRITAWLRLTWIFFFVYAVYKQLV